jgi:hypothetical protein
MSWVALQQKLAELFNIYPTLLQAQYRLSTEPKGSLPFDLASQDHLDSLCKNLRPLIVPRVLANG